MISFLVEFLNINSDVLLESGLQQNILANLKENTLKQQEFTST